MSCRVGVCVCVCVCACVRVCVWVWLCVCMRVRVWVCVCTCVRVRVWVCVRVRMCAHACVYAHALIDTYGTLVVFILVSPKSEIQMTGGHFMIIVEHQCMGLMTS